MAVVCLPVGQLQTNCYLIFDENNTGVVVDPGDDASQIIDAINEYKLDVKAILLTHTHFDHIMAVNEVKEYTKAPVYVPEKDEPALSNNKLSLMPPNRPTIHADVLLYDGDVINFGDIKFNILETPGHTPGSSCFIYKDNMHGDVIISGDTLFNGSIGRTDFLGGNIQQMNESLIKLASLAGDYIVFPGHGPDTTLDYERKYNPYMKPLL